MPRGAAGYTPRGSRDLFDEEPEVPPNDGITDDLGEIVGGYRLEERIASGGMGHVYAATHTRLNRRAAIKVLSTKFTNDESVLSRFYHEAKIANDVRHPNIIDIFDFVELSEPRRVACIMELLEGPSLRHRLRSDGPLSPIQAANVIIQLSRALEAVHEKQVVHRDLKPDNVVVTGDLTGDLSPVPSVKLLDFGIAKSQEAGSAHRTNTGMMLGTPAYMAPEQIVGEWVGPPTDVYALGELLYEMISGRRLFPGKSMEVLRRKLATTEIDCNLPPTTPGAAVLSALVRACIQAEPRRRPSLEGLREGVDALRREWVAGGPRAPNTTEPNKPSSADLLPATVDLSPRGEGTPQPTMAARPWSSPAQDAAHSALRSDPVAPNLAAQVPTSEHPNPPARRSSGSGSAPPATILGRAATPAPRPASEPAKPVGPSPSPNPAAAPTAHAEAAPRASSASAAPAAGFGMFDRAPTRPAPAPLPLPLPVAPAPERRPPRRWMTVLLLAILLALLPLVFSETLREEVIGVSIAFVAPRLLGNPTEEITARQADWDRLQQLLGGVLVDAKETPESLLVQAKNAARADRHRDNQEALGLWTRALALRPRDPALMTEWVRALALARGSSWSREDRANAEALLAIAGELRPGLPGIDAARAELVLRQGRSGEAARRAQAALRKIPDQGSVRLTLAEALSTTDPERALSELELIRRGDPGHRRVDRVAARAYLYSGRPRAALDLLQKRLKSDPKNAAVLTLYGEVEQAIGNEAKAQQRWESAIAGEGDTFLARIASGWSHLEQRNFQKAELAFQGAASLPGLGGHQLEEAQLGLARTALARGERIVPNELKAGLDAAEDPAAGLATAELAAASGAFARVEELAPRLTRHAAPAAAAWLLLAKAASARGDEAATREARAQALGAAPKDPAVRVILSAQALEQNDRTQAEDLLLGLGKFDPRDLEDPSTATRYPLPNFLLDEAVARWTMAGRDPKNAALSESALAAIAWRRGELNEAKTRAKHSLELDPTEGRIARAVLVQLALTQGNGPEALPHAEAWAKGAPETVGPHLARARALALNNKKSEALLAYERALQLDPTLTLAGLERRTLLAGNDRRSLEELIRGALRDRPGWPAVLRLAFHLGL